MENLGQTDAREVKLRAHLRHVLGNYMLDHILIDQLSYTSELVSNFLSTLECVLDFDSSSLALPVDPLDILCERLQLSSLPPHNEQLSINPDAIAFIKAQMALVNGVPKSQMVWYEEEEHRSRPHVPLSPILTRFSSRNTPVLANSKDKHALFDSVNGIQLQQLITHDTIGIPLESVPDDPIITVEACMDTKLSVDVALHADIVKLHKANHFSSKPFTGASVLRGNAQSFLASKSPPLIVKTVHPMSPPLFARHHQRQAKQYTRVEPQTLAEAVSTMESLPIAESDPDMADKNMTIIDGWTAYLPSSSPSTPSLSSGSSQVDELDEIWMPSSDDVNLLKRSAASAKMDDHQFPRAKRIRTGSLQRPKSIVDDRSLSTFLSNVIDVIPGVVTTTCSDGPEEASLTVPPSSPTAFMPMTSSEGSLSIDMNRMLGGMKPKSYYVPIMHEKLDNKETMFMEVPILPPPTTYCRILNVPRDLAALVIGSTQGNVVNDRLGQLDKVTGIKPLNLELSWRPFRYEGKMPTHDEILDVQDPLSSASVLQSAERHLLNDLLAESMTEPRLSASHQSNSFLSGYASPNPPAIPSSADREMAFLFPRTEKRPPAGGEDASNNQILHGSQANHTSDVTYQDVIEAEAQAILTIQPYQSPHPLFTFQPHSSNMGSETPLVSTSTVYPKFGHLMQIHQQADIEEEDEMACRSLSTLEDDLNSSITPPECYPNHATKPYRDAEYPSDPHSFSTRDLSTYDRTQPVYEHAQLHHGDACSLPEVTPFHSAPDDPRQYARNIDSSTTFSPSRTNIHSALASVTHHPVHIGRNTKSLSLSPPTKTANTTDLLCDRGSFKMSEFYALRRGGHPPENHPSSSPPANSRPSQIQDNYLPDNNLNASERQETPMEIRNDPNYLKPPSPWPLPPYERPYLVSLEVMQKLALVRFLECRICSVNLIGRENIQEVDAVVDPQSAIIFSSLAALPSQGETLLTRVCKSSWHYNRLLVIFEAFPSSACYRLKKDEIAAPFAYGPPTMKAVKRFKRDLTIHDGLGDKNVGCTVQISFANSVEEAATVSRYFGDLGGGEQEIAFGEYIGEDEQEGEADLSGVAGMNAFTATVMLGCFPVNKILEMSAEQRREGFGPLTESLNTQLQDNLNTILAKRTSAESL